MIDRIAADLGIHRYVDEPLLQYRCRVVYSAIACWMKAIALDRPVGSLEKDTSGVSRRHMYERSNAIMGTIIRMFPEVEEWFDLSEDNDNPTSLIRRRLINHGDLLNAGYKTNLALSGCRSIQLTPTIEVVYGKIIDETIHYSGIASTRQKKAICEEKELENVKEWFRSFISEAAWFNDLPDMQQFQFFNPLSTVKNNYAAWQESISGISGSVILVRTSLNKNSYSYYLFKPKEKLIHRIDPFLQEQGFHIRAMCALRSYSNNKTRATATSYADHVKLRLNALLPMKESIILESYAWPVRHINDKLEWVMSDSIWAYIRQSIDALDIQITEEQHG